MRSGAIFLELAIIVILILVNGLLAMSEMAIVSSRKVRLQQLADSGNLGAKAALALAAEPSNFLASIQIGITLIGILAGAFGGATIAEEIANVLRTIPWLASFSDAIGLGVVVMTVTFLSLVVGELVPKRVALSNAERTAAMVGRPIQLLSIVAGPIVRVLTIATENVLKVIGIKPSEEPSVTEEEVKALIEQGAETGVFEKEEGSMMKRALAFADRRVGELMTPRRQLIALDINASFQDSIGKIMAAPHSYFPVYQGTPDHLIGIVSNKCILDRMVRNQTLEINLTECLTESLFVSESMPTLKVLEHFKQTGKHIGLVVDEYGATAGLITLTDLMEALVGDLPNEKETDAASFVRRDDGSLLIDGMFPIYELTELLGTIDPHDEIEGDFQTLGGFVMQRLGHIPREGEKFHWQDYLFEVMDMDAHRVDKVLVIADKSEQRKDR